MHFITLHYGLKALNGQVMSFKPNSSSQSLQMFCPPESVQLLCIINSVNVKEPKNPTQYESLLLTLIYLSNILVASPLSGKICMYSQVIASCCPTVSYSPALNTPLKCFSFRQKVREWFAEVQRRLDTGSDPFQDPATGRTDRDEEGEGEGADTQGEASTAAEEQTGTGMGDEEDDEGDEEDDCDESDDSEVWEPSRSVRKSLSVSED